MKIFLLPNNWLGLKISQFLKSKNEQIVGAAIHAKNKQRYVKEILSVLKLPKKQIFDGLKLRDPKYVEDVKSLKPDLIILCGWAYILKSELIHTARLGVINMHPGFLPYNRGMNPNVWPIIEGTPAGATLHFVEEGVDSGPIIAQTEVPIEPLDTGGTLYDKTIYAMVDLFKKTWPLIKKGNIVLKPQDEKEVTFHFAKDIDKIDRIDLDRTYKARDLINILRARTYQDRTYAFFEENGKKVYISLQLSHETTREYPGPVDKEEGFRKYK